MTFFGNTKNIIDSGNSTTSLLGAGATFTGTWTENVNYNTISIAILGDNDSNGTLWIDVRKIGETIVSSVPYTITSVLASDSNLPHIWNIVESEYRIRYVNGATAQTGTFNLTTKLATTQQLGLLGTVNGTVYNTSPTTLQKIANTVTQDRNFGRLGNESSLRVLAKNGSVPGSGFETVWTGADNGLSGIYPTVTATETVRVRAGGNANDTAAGTGARVVTVVGLDTNFNEISEDINLAGASASSATTATFRAINNFYVKEWGTFQGDNNGTIILENTTSLQDLACINIGAGRQQSAVYTVPAGKTMYVKNIFVQVGDNNSADITLIRFMDTSDTTAPLMAGKFVDFEVVDYTGSDLFEFDTYLKFDEKTMLRLDAKRNTGSGTAFVSASWDYILLDN